MLLNCCAILSNCVSGLSLRDGGVLSEVVKRHTEHVMSAHILIIEDEPLLAANYRDLLSRAGYSVSVALDADAARDRWQTAAPDLLLLDIGLNGDPEAGFELCRELRSQAPTLPIVFLTARDDEVDVISGLRLGADDYLTKDISQAQLLARITALLRRIRAMSAPEQIEHVLKRGALSLNQERLTTHWRDALVPLTFTEFWMVHALAKHPGHIKSRDQLMTAANVVLDDSTVTSHIRRIRAKFQEADPAFDRIETAYGLGYRWLADAA
jgi:two-component system OmpR family response regulator